MNIAELHEITGQLVKAGKGKREVLVSKDTFTHPLEADGCKILPVEIAELHAYELMDDDGGFTDEQKVSLVLFGAAERDERIYAEQRKLNMKVSESAP